MSATISARLDAWLGTDLSARIKRCWWWVSDSEWRRAYMQNASRVRHFRHGQDDAISELLNASGNRILAGPFAGMRFAPAGQRGVYCAQILLGTYELEVHGALEEICASSYSLILEIGADVGYYACGLRMRLPAVPVIAFESAVTKHDRIRELLAANGIVDGVTIRGRCDGVTLDSIIRGEARVLIFCDIDGAEVEVLNPAAAPLLAAADILVETHDGLRPGITSLLVERFQRTHDIVELRERPRTVQDAPTGVGLTEDQLMVAMDEFRGFPQSWLWMRSHVRH
jgi:hypothetical protein